MQIIPRFLIGKLNILKYCKRYSSLKKNLLRKWMVVDENGSFLTQRQIPKLALIKISIGEECLVFNAPNKDPIKVPLEHPKKKRQCRYLIVLIRFK